MGIINLTAAASLVSASVIISLLTIVHAKTVEDETMGQALRPIPIKPFHADHANLRTPEGYSLYQGDMLLTYQQMVEAHGTEFTASLIDGGYVFPPFEEPVSVKSDENRAVQVEWIWPQTNRLNSDDKVYIPYDIASVGYTSSQEQTILDAMETLEVETQMFKFIDYSEWFDLLSAGASIPNHFIKFENLDGCWSYVGKNTGDTCSVGNCSTCTCQRISLQNSNFGTCLTNGIIVHGE